MTEAEEFDSWWALCWRKVGKGAARRAFAKARKIASYDDLCAAAQAFGEKVRRAGTEERFQPHPSTWLNAERWTDADINPAQKKIQIVCDTDRAIDRVSLALKGIRSANLSKADVDLALKAQKITQEQAKRLGL